MMNLPRNLILALLAANLWLTGCDRNRQEKAPSEEATVVEEAAMVEDPKALEELDGAALEGSDGLEGAARKGPETLEDAALEGPEEREDTAPDEPEDPEALEEAVAVEERPAGSRPVPVLLRRVSCPHCPSRGSP